MVSLLLPNDVAPLQEMMVLCFGCQPKPGLSIILTTLSRSIEAAICIHDLLAHLRSQGDCLLTVD